MSDTSTLTRTNTGDVWIAPASGTYRVGIDSASAEPFIYPTTIYDTFQSPVIQRVIPAVPPPPVEPDPEPVPLQTERRVRLR